MEKTGNEELTGILETLTSAGGEDSCSHTHSDNYSTGFFHITPSLYFIFLAGGKRTAGINAFWSLIQ